MRIRGKIRFYNERKGFGFIKREDDLGDIFLHATALPEGLDKINADQRVEFEIEQHTRGERARNVSLA